MSHFSFYLAQSVGSVAVNGRLDEIERQRGATKRVLGDREQRGRLESSG